jgi:hypothetical protein
MQMVDRVFIFGPSSVKVRVDAPLSVKDVGDVIRKFTERSKLGGKITLRLADSFDALPEEVRKAAEDAGGTKDNTYAVLHQDGSLWFVRGAHATREQLEKSIFHTSATFDIKDRFATIPAKGEQNGTERRPTAISEGGNRQRISVLPEVREEHARQVDARRSIISSDEQAPVRLEGVTIDEAQIKQSPT